MIGNKFEYEKMHKVEKNLWWYRNLHRLTIKNINYHFNNKDIKILDAGCGTGGLIEELIKNEYNNIDGFDLSEDAIFFAKDKLVKYHKNTRLFQHNLTEPLKFDKKYDVIISNDTLYFLSKREQIKLLENFNSMLNKNGLIILNLPYSRHFSGIHDQAVGIKNRFEKEHIKDIINQITNLQIADTNYWPLFLSPIIYFSRLIQRRKIKSDNYDIKSDVNMPNKFLNKIFYSLCYFENLFYFLKISFSSSLLLTLKKL